MNMMDLFYDLVRKHNTMAQPIEYIEISPTAYYRLNRDQGTNQLRDISIRITSVFGVEIRVCGIPSFEYAVVRGPFRDVTWWIDWSPVDQAVEDVIARHAREWREEQERKERMYRMASPPLSKDEENLLRFMIKVASIGSAAMSVEYIDQWN